MATKKKIVIKKNIGPINNNIKLKMIDLCAGTGAFSYVLSKTGKVDVVFANDIEESSKKLYDNNFNHKLTLENLCTIDVKTIPSHDILTAGFPCQPFSIAGKREGFDDPRSNVFWKIIEIVKFHKPECIILENVKNLGSHDDGDTLKTIITSLEKEKYNIKYKILNTSKITGVPQNRERIYIVCLKNKDIYDAYDMTFAEKKKNSIKQYLSNNVEAKYYYNDNTNNIHKMIMESIDDDESVYQFRRKYVRKNMNNDCPTLTANMGTGGHNVPIVMDDKGIRKLTPRECFNLQGFPETYLFPKMSDSKLYKLAGNAVSVPVVELVTSQLIEKLYNKINNIII
jgi:DNA (cytosine-5)-methyltransferase 1